jgi:hypothetical protein
VEKWSPSNSRGSTEAANRRIGPRTSRLKDHRGSVDGRKSEDSGGGNMLFVTRILACCEVGESKLVQDHGVSMFKLGAYRIVTPKKSP